MAEYSSKIAKAIHSYLTNDDWKFSFDESRGVFSFGLTLDCKIQHVDYRILIHDSAYTVYTLCPLGADINDKECFMKTAEFLCRANYGLRNGNFEFDFNDGEIRYKVYYRFDDGDVPSEDAISSSIFLPARMFERYSMGIIGVLFGGLDPKHACEMCEQD